MAVPDPAVVTQTPPRAGAPSPVDTRTTGQLAMALSDQVSRLVKDEIALATADVKSKVTKLATGAGLLVGAALLLLCMVVALLVAAGLGFALVVSSWLAALIMAAIFLLVAAGLGFVGIRQVKRGAPPVPKEAIGGLKTDLAIVKQAKP